MGFEVDFLAVGEGERSGDAIAIRSGNLTGPRSEQFVMVIDGGTLESGDTLVEHIQGVYCTDRVDLVVNTHPDGDHASGLSRVLEGLDVNHLWMHRPWTHSSEIKHMFDDGTLSNDLLSAKMRKALSDAWDLEKITKRKGIPITEPFSDGESNRQYQGIYVLGPSEDYYQSLLPGFREMPDVREAIANYLGDRFRSFAKGAVALAERVLETWGKETLQEPAEDATSSENNSSAIILLRVEGKGLALYGRRRSASPRPGGQPGGSVRYKPSRMPFSADAPPRQQEERRSPATEQATRAETARPEHHEQNGHCVRS